jgi:hypothetical protein
MDGSLYACAPALGLLRLQYVAALQRFRDLAALRYREGATIYLEVADAETLAAKH